MKKELQEVYIPIKEHSEFKVLEDGISLQNVYPQEAVVFTQEEYNEHLKEVIQLARQVTEWHPKKKDYTFEVDGLMGYTEVCTHNMDMLSNKELMEHFNITNNE